MDDAPTTSPVLLYGLLAADAASDAALDTALEQPGVQGAPVRLVSCGPLRALASSVPDPAAFERGSAGLEALALDHKAVIDAVFDVCTVLPLRFGTLAEADDVPVLVADDAQAHLDRLRALEGRAEMGVRLTVADPDEAGAAPASATYRSDRPGTAYLLARQTKYARRDGRLRRIGRTYREALAEMTHEMVSAPAYGDDDAVSLAFLIDRADADAFREAVSGVHVPAVSDVEVVGPWAPYSFV